MNRRFTWPDERLIKAAQDGDLSSLTTVVVQSQPHVRKFALSLCASPQDAEDAAQEALIILYRKIGTLRATGALASWMFRIVRNECLRQVRLLATRRDGAPDEPEAGEGPSAEESVLHRLEVERIAAAVGALPRDQRQVLIMRDIQGLPGRAVADALGLSGAAMKSRLHRARTTLRRSLAATGRTPGAAVDPPWGGDPRP
ncbi:RNA polymerase sigma factor [Streptomyces sp. NPDC015130]|uniref:RNA polymerase sigma factor n=1 Tax=Streptomyces sp. NPDC015130 TaxID=3364940 RepID=UPI0036F7E048